jgi:fructan beta-fructosidase
MKRIVFFLLMLPLWLFAQEKHRPYFHFTPPFGWMNDPNGMIYYEGEYHLFYQHYPDGTQWGPMHWGHAVSKDLLKWEHLPIALYPDTLGYIFSGSAVIDHENTTGLGYPMVAIFTYHQPELEKEGRNDYQYQGIAYSLDKGRSWTKYHGNPVLPNTSNIRDFRDPKVFWHKATNRWMMVFAAFDHIQLWSSPNLIDWTYVSEFGKTMGHHGGVWECPDLFPLKTRDGKEEKWVMLVSINPGGPNGGSGTQYFIGEFDGVQFTAEQNDWIEFGRDNYAGVTFSNIPDIDGRKIFIGWMSNWDYANQVPTDRWRSAMTIPRSFILEKENQTFRLISSPLNEIYGIMEHVEDNQLVIPGYVKMEFNLNEPLELAFTSPSGDRYILEYVPKMGFYSDRSRVGSNDFSDKFATDKAFAPYLADRQISVLEIFIDVASIELFVDGGNLVMTEILFPESLFTDMKVKSNEEKHEVKFYKIINK